MVFENPGNGYKEAPSAPWFWTLLFGCFYLLFKGAWAHALIAFILATITVGFSWLIYPFFAKGIIRATYLRKGWKELA